MKSYRWIISFVVLWMAVTVQKSLAQHSGDIYVSTMDQSKMSVRKAAFRKVEKGSPLAKVLKLIENKYGVHILYNTELIAGKDLSKARILHFDRGIYEMLGHLLPEFGFTFKKRSHRTLGIVPKQEVLPININKILQETITGTVTNASTGETLPGVNIQVKGTTTGTATDANGRYGLTVESLQDTLVFSFVGYQTQQIPMNGRTEINIEMQSQAIAGQGMVVTALGQEQEQRVISYSTEEVDTEHLTDARELNVINSLQGKVSGLSINPSGSGVGAPSRVVLRGNRSITGDNQPLYVVDGVPVLGEPQNFNPDNIASINVLKGSNAAAIYGSEAQNGAIVIETKKGKRGDVDVSFNSNFMLNNPNLRSDYQNEFAQGIAGQYQKGARSSWGPKMQGQMVEHWTLDPSRAGETYPLTPQPNNIQDIYRNGKEFSENIQVSVGSENTQSVFSTTYTDAEGILPNNALQRINSSLRVISDLSDKLTLDGKVSYMNEETNNPTDTGLTNFNPIQQVANIPRNISYEDMINFEFEGPQGIMLQDYWNKGGNSFGENPFWVFNRVTGHNKENRIIGMSSLVYDFTNDLSLMIRGSYDRVEQNFEQKKYYDTFVEAPKGRYSVNESIEYEFNTDFLLSFNKKLNDDWNIEANLGGSIKKRRNRSLNSNTGRALLVPNFFTLSNTNDPQTSYDPGASSDRQSLYAFGNIGWKNALFLNITGRNDWSSTLPADSRSYFYPSIGLSAVLSDLIPAFPALFSFSRVRISWAKVGSSPSPFRLQRLASFKAGGPNGFLSIGNVLPNENLKPEETKSLEIGLDVRFIADRIGLDATYFNTSTINQLFTISLPVASGASSFFTNGGDIKNKGVEFQLTTNPIQTQNITWDFDINFSHITNTVEKISDERPRVVISGGFFREYVIEQGMEFGAMFSKGFRRDDQNRVIVGSDGIPLLTGGKSYNMGSFTPDWRGGISSNFSFKNISLSFSIDHRQGGTVGSFTNALLNSLGQTEATLQGRDGGLIFGENFFPDETAVLRDATANNIEINAEDFWTTVGYDAAPVGEVFAYDATNTRLRELTIGYNIPQSVIRELPVSNVKFTLVGRNLFFIYRKNKSIDPEILTSTETSAEGFSSFPPPTTRTFGFNLNIDF